MLTKKDFIARCDVHKYGNSVNAMKVVYFTDDYGNVYIYVYFFGTRREHLNTFYTEYSSGKVGTLTIVPKDKWNGVPIVWSKVNYYLENY